jgi:hypothetical protein
MIYQYNDRLQATQPRERQVGEASLTRRPDMSENTSPADPELDELVERVRWEMRREPMRERRRGGLAW